MLKAKCWLSRMWPWVICTLAAVFYCYEYLLRVTPSIMVPDLMQHFSCSAATLGFLSSLYYYAYTPIQLPVGLLMDKYGPRRILTLAVGACAIGTAVFASTDALWVAGLGRFLVGFGSAFAFVGVLKLATVWLPANYFAMVSGMATTLGMFGAISGGLFMGRLTQSIGWQSTLLYSSAIGFVLLPMTWLIIRDHRSPQQKTKTVETTALLHQVRAIFSNPQIWLNGFIGGLLFLPTSVFAELWGVQYMQVVHDMSKSDAAFAVSLIFLGWALGGPVMGFASDMIQRRRLPLMMGSIFATILLSLIMYTDLFPVWMLYSIFVLFGFVSSVQIICFAVGRENAPNQLSGTALATTNFLIMIGGMIFQPVVGKILDWTWDGKYLDGLRLYSVESYQLALSVLPLGLLLSVVCLFFLKETHCQTQV